mgnify:CR=1 FL=1
MNVFTSRFGDIEINKEEIIVFPNGVLGFEEMKKYIILKMDEDNPLMWLQSLEEPALAFVIINPYEFRDEYEVELNEDDVKLLKIDKPEDVKLYSIVVVPHGEPAKMTANLQGPVVINSLTRLGKQVVLKNSKYSVKHYILEEMKEKAKKAQGGK